MIYLVEFKGGTGDFTANYYQFKAHKWVLKVGVWVKCFFEETYLNICLRLYYGRKAGQLQNHRRSSCQLASSQFSKVETLFQCMLLNTIKVFQKIFFYKYYKG